MEWRVIFWNRVGYLTHRMGRPVELSYAVSGPGSPSTGAAVLRKRSGM